MCVSEVEVVAEALYFDGSMYSMVVHGLDIIHFIQLCNLLVKCTIIIIIIIHTLTPRKHVFCSKMGGSMDDLRKLSMDYAHPPRAKLN